MHQNSNSDLPINRKLDWQAIKNFRSIVVRGLPRQGKTHWAISELIKQPSGIYITHRHEIVKHAIKIFKSLTKENTCVWLEGKVRSCKTGKLNCSSCLMKPDIKEGHISYGELEAIVERLLDKYKVLTKEVILKAEDEEDVEEYGGLCPYYCLKIASRKVKYIFTVPQLCRELPSKYLLIIDEDPTIDYFYPKSVVICEYTHNNKEKSIKITIPKEIEKMREIKYKHHAPDIRRATEFILKVKELLEKFKEGSITLKELNESLEQLEFPEFADAKDVLNKIDELLAYDEIKYFYEPVLFPAKKRFYWESNSNGSKFKLWMVADEEYICRDIPHCDKHILIGATKTELFAKQMFEDYGVMQISDIPYINNMILFLIGYREKDEKGRVTLNRKKVRSILRKIASKFNRANIPILMVTGSEEQQERCASLMREHYVLTHTVKNESVDQIIDVLLSGATAIIYANSNISRGVDLDFYDVEIMYNVDFSTPYWSAMVEYWKSMIGKLRNKEEEGDPAEDKIVWYTGMRENIISDEMFNLIFRIAPVRGRWEDQLKVVFIPEYYLNRMLTTALRIGGVDVLEKLASRMLLLVVSPDNDIRLGKFSEPNSTGKVIFRKLIDSEDYILKMVDTILSHFRRIDRERDINVLSDITALNGGNIGEYYGYRNTYTYPEKPIFDLVRSNSLIKWMKERVIDVVLNKILDSSTIQKIEKAIVSVLKKSMRTERIWKKIRSKFEFVEYRTFKNILESLVERGIVKVKKKGKKYVWWYESDNKESSGVNDKNNLNVLYDKKMDQVNAFLNDSMKEGPPNDDEW